MNVSLQNQLKKNICTFPKVTYPCIGKKYACLSSSSFFAVENNVTNLDRSIKMGKKKTQKINENLLPRLEKEIFFGMSTFRCTKRKPGKEQAV